jgi:polyisoprenoid-binding protein YceI
MTATPPYIAFTVDARKLTLVADKKLSTEQQAEVQHTMQASVLQSKLYPFISLRSTKIEKTGVDHWLVTGELTLRGETRPIQADVQYTVGGSAFSSLRLRLDCKPSSACNFSHHSSSEW